MVQITGSHTFQSSTYLLYEGKAYEIKNPSCSANAKDLLASYLNVENDGVFMMAVKTISPEIKSHKKYF